MKTRLAGRAEVNFFGYDNPEAIYRTFGISVYFGDEISGHVGNLIGLWDERNAIHFRVRDDIQALG